MTGFLEQLLGGMNDARQDNRNALMMAGSGLLSGNSWQSGLANMGQSMVAGRQMDAMARDKKAKVARQNQTDAYLQQHSPELYGMVQAGGMSRQGALKSLYSNRQKSDQSNRTAKFIAQKHGMPYEQALTIAQSGQAGDYMKPQKKAQMPASIREFEYGQENPDYRNYQTEMKKAGATKVNFNEGQGKAAGYADRMFQSEKIIRQHEQAGTSMQDKLASGVPVVGNYLTSDNYKHFDQAKRDFVNAILRRESGAVISDQEFANAEVQYFPQPGDSPQVIEQKRKNRETAIYGIQRAAGPNYEGQQLEQQTPQQPDNVVDYSDYFK